MNRRLGPALFLIAGSAIACAYYNGLYNANQLASEAKRAENEGRRGEARSLWLQAAVKAESVIVRYPESNRRDEALLMHGLALSRIGECSDGIASLEEATRSSSDDAVRTQAYQILGECYLDLDQPDAAWNALSALVNDPDPIVASRALWWRGRAGLARGDPDSALVDLRRSSEPEAVLDRATALLMLGRVADAAAALDTARSLPFNEDRWMVALDDVGAADVRVSGPLVDSLVSDKRLTRGQRARLLIAEGNRWTEIDAVRTRQLYLAAREAAGDSAEGRLAEGLVVIAAVRGTRDLDTIPILLADFDDLMADGGTVASVVEPFSRVLSDAQVALDPAPNGDLVLFREAEEMRDSLSARHLSAEMFLLVVSRYPQSAIAPKALLAAAALEPSESDSLLVRLRRSYPDSPYTRAAYGKPAPRFAIVEDSIRTLLNQVRITRAGTGNQPEIEWQPAELPDSNETHQRR